MKLFEHARSVYHYNRIFNSLLKFCSKESDQFYRHINESKEPLLSLISQDHGVLLGKLIVIKLLNLIVLRYEYSRAALTLSAKPYGLLIDPSNSCSCACPGCVHSLTAGQNFDWPKGNLPDNVFAEFLGKFGIYATHIGFYNYGEPLVNRKTPEYLLAAKKLDCVTAISTNLSVNNFDAEALVASGLDKILLSIDGFSQSIYEKYRKQGNMELVMANLKAIVLAKKRQKSSTPYISWQYLVFEHNKHEITAAKRFAVESGVNRFFTVRPSSVAWDDDSIKVANDIKYESVEIKSRHETVLKQIPLDHERINSAFETLSFENSLDNIPARTNCDWLYKGAVADAVGRVMPCCGAPQHQTNHIFSNVMSADPFNSEAYNISRAFQSGISGSTRENLSCVNCSWEKNSLYAYKKQLNEYFKKRGYLRKLSYRNYKSITNF